MTIFLKLELVKTNKKERHICGNEPKSKVLWFKNAAKTSCSAKTGIPFFIIPWLVQANMIS